MLLRYPLNVLTYACLLDTLGEPIIHEWSGRKIRLFDDLPHKISTAVEGGRMDFWFRKDSRITMSDIIDRMNPKFIKSSDLPKLPTLDDPTTEEEYERYGDPYTDANKIARLQAKKKVRKNTVDTLLTRRLSNRVTRFRQQHNLLAPETRRIDQTSSGEDMKKVNNLNEEKRLANVAWEIEGDKMFHPQPKLKRSTVSNYQRTRYPLSARLNPTGYSSRVAAIIAELRKKDALASLKDRRNPRNQDKRKQTIAERRERRRHTQVEVDETDRKSRKRRTLESDQGSQIEHTARIALGVPTQTLPSADERRNQATFTIMRLHHAVHSDE
ncbi:hypothetical protein LTR60_000925 [Cryomyces antarcticus]|nr:hypothetical protein LTR60_000925 [Cryomyces antarcticus]